MTASKKIFKKISFQYASLILCGVLSFFVGVLIARELGPAKFGTYLLLITYGGYIAHFYDLGLKTYIYKNNDNQNKILNSAFVNYTYQIFIVSSAALLFYYIIPDINFHFFDYSSMLIAFAMMGFFQLIVHSLKSNGLLELEALLQLAFRALSFLFILAVLLVTENIGLIFMAIFLTTLLVIGFSFWKLRLKIEHSNRILIASTVPFFTLDLMIGFYTKFELVMLSFVETDLVQIGQYGAATRILDAQHTVIFPFAVLYFNILKGNFDFQFIRRLSLPMFLCGGLFIGILAYAASYLIMPALIALFFGEDYNLSIEIYKTLALVLVASILNIFAFQKMIYLGLTKSLMVCTALACLISLLANIMLTLNSGLLGAIYSRIIVEYIILFFFVSALFLVKPKSQPGL